MKAAYFLTLLLGVTWTSTVLSLSIVSSTSPSLQSKITFKCGGDAVDLDSSLQAVRRVSLSRRKHTNPSVDEIIATLDTGNLLNPDLAWQTEGNLGNGWGFTFPTKQEVLDSSLARDIIKLEVTLDSASCDDSGEYICSVTAADSDGKEFIDQKSQMMNVTVLPQNIRLDVTPDNVGNRVEENTTVTMSCHADATLNYKFFWKIRCPPPPGSFQGFQRSFELWPVLNEIGEQQQTDLNRPCGILRHSQTLTFQIAEEHDECMIKCEIGDFSDADDNLQANYTFSVVSMDVVTDVPASTGLLRIIPSTEKILQSMCGNASVEFEVSGYPEPNKYILKQRLVDSQKIGDDVQFAAVPNHMYNVTFVKRAPNRWKVVLLIHSLEEKDSRHYRLTIKNRMGDGFDYEFNIGAKAEQDCPVSDKCSMPLGVGLTAVCALVVSVLMFCF